MPAVAGQISMDFAPPHPQGKTQLSPATVILNRSPLSFVLGISFGFRHSRLRHFPSLTISFPSSPGGTKLPVQQNFHLMSAKKSSFISFLLAFFMTWTIAFAPVAYSAEPSAKRAPHIFFLIGEAEYQTKTTVPAFAQAELEPRGIHCTFSLLPSEESNEFPNLDALKDADVLFVSVRRHTPPQAQMDAIRAFVKSGKAIVGIRTASHAFALRPIKGQPAKVPAGLADWPEFDHEILGGNYSDHYGHDIETFAKPIPFQMKHPILAGFSPDEFKVTSHLYKNPNLPDWVTPLLTARMSGHPEVEPIAWVNTKDHRRVFYTSLGAPEDFALPQFRLLLLNGIFWTLDKPVPAIK